MMTRLCNNYTLGCCIIRNILHLDKHDGSCVSTACASVQGVAVCLVVAEVSVVLMFQVANLALVVAFVCS